MTGTLGALRLRLLALGTGASSTAMLGILMDGIGRLGSSSGSPMQIDGMFDDLDTGALSSAKTILGIAIVLASGCGWLGIGGAAGVDR